MKNALGMDLDQTASLNTPTTDRAQTPQVAKKKADVPKKPRAPKRKKGDDPLIWIGKSWYVDKHIAGRGRVRRSLRTADKKKARTKAQMVIAEERAKMALGQGGCAKGSPTLEAAVQAWLDTKLQIDATTLVKYSDDVRAFVKSIRPTMIARLTKTHVEEWYRGMYARAEAGLSVDGANNARKAVLEFVRWARSEKAWIGFDVKMPTIFVKGESRRRVQREIVRPEAFQQLIDAVTGTDYEVYARIAYTTGMRSSEILSLDWSQVDFDDCRVVLEPWQVKGKRKAREAVFITNEAAEALRPFAKATGRVVPSLPPIPQREDYGSKLAFGKALKRLSSRVAHKFGQTIRRGARENTAIHGIRGHLLRHSYITLAIEAGAPIGVVAKSAGHSTTWITERYSHVKAPSGPLIADAA